MAQTCKICAHPQMADIDLALQTKQSYAQIAIQFDTSKQSVRYHAVNHVAPMIEKALAKAETKFVNQMAKLRTEVNFAPVVKIKMLQDKLLTELDAASDLNERVTVIRELRGWFQEEAKIGGLYTQERQNPETIARQQEAIKQTVLAMIDEGIDRDEIVNLVAEAAVEEFVN